MNTVAQKYGRVMPHGFNSAVITNTQGEKVGSIIIRYTKSINAGYNSETQLITRKGGEIHNITGKSASYNRSKLFYMLEGIGAKCFSHHGDQYHGRTQQAGEGVSIHGVSRASDLTAFKIGNRKYNVLWVQS